jgi:hypothetical protein
MLSLHVSDVMVSKHRPTFTVKHEADICVLRYLGSSCFLEYSRQHLTFSACLILRVTRNNAAAYSVPNQHQEYSFSNKKLPVVTFLLLSHASLAILHLFSLLLPEGHCIPDTLDKVRKVVHDLGLDYEKIHACVNDCVLFQKNYARMDKCPTCGESR